ncbi:U2 small nuclear ribonucleoprotein A' [Salmo salar]|uniref:U2 small nuclear ribonucleoprotein A' n=1 Tax=Salmo salar TaxID=8030 RepID=A0ABM3E0S4_SALSA|nr:U2 small nuclear ribonucleoprotein A'-like [Salmo salar]|eukprot:XP_014031831.1 PREDICTED: U2 small nuclear ribonucleoprotein A'-like [Salmo salar]
MVKLSAELIEQAAQYTNPVRDRELDLRGYKIPVLENLGATLDQFDTIDFSDNEIRKLDGFPLLKRLKTLLMNNNRICRVGENLEQALPSMRELILTSNNIQELGDLDPLASVKTLTLLSLLRNPVTNKKHYRLYVINKIPQIHVLDFQKVKLKERQEAEKMFKGKRGAQLAKDIAKRTKTFTPGAAVQQPEKKKMGPSPADVEAIKNAIANASSLAEVERLKGMLQAGQIPGREVRQVPPEMVEVEEEENGVVHMEREIQTEEGNGVEEMEEDVVEVQGKVEEVQGKVEEVDVKEVEEVDVKEVEEVEKEEVEEEEGREEGEEQESEEDESEDDDMDEDSPVNGS